MSIEKAKAVGRGLLLRLEKVRMERIFLLIFLGFGLLFVVIVPAGWNTDETNHTYRIYQLSAGNLLAEQVVTPRTGLKAYGGEVPAGLVGLYDKTGANEPGSFGNVNRKIDEDLYKKQSGVWSLGDDGQRTVMNFSGAALYSPVSYAIYVPVFLVGKVLSLPFLWIIILSRLVGLMLTGLAFLFAIRLIPIGKWLVFAVGLIPTVIVQASTVGADAPQLAISVLFIAWITRLLFVPKKPRLLDYGLLAVLGASLVLIKFAYAPLLLLLLALPLLKREYRGRKHIALTVLTVTLALLPGLMWLQLVSYIDINSNPQADFAAQKLFVVSQPVTYLKTLYHTFFTNMQPTAVGNIFGSFIWDSVQLPAIYAYLASAALVSSLFVKSGQELTTRLSRRAYNLWRLVLILTSLITVVLVATALYVYSTTLHQSNIVGIQSRYFIPLLPMILLVFYGNTAKNQRVVKAGIIMMSCIALVGAILAICLRLYQSPALIIS